MKIPKLILFSALSILGCHTPEKTPHNKTEQKTVPEKTNKTEPKKTLFTIGECITFHSEILKEDRILNVYLPQGFHTDSAQNYNVIYLLDGSNDEDFIHISGILQFAAFPWIEKIPPSILVGIANVDRQRDFTYPTTVEADKKELPTTGSSDKFIRFIHEEVFELIESTYPVSSARTLIGQSLGGLLAAEILYKNPEMFENYIIISPSLWWDAESLLKTEPKDLQHVKSVFIGVGNEEEVMQRTAKELYLKLQKSLPKETNLRFKYYEKQDHGDVMHLAIYDALMKN